MYILEPKVQIRENCLLLYNQPTITAGRKHDLSQNKAYSGKVTNHAAKRIRRAIDILCQKSPTKTIYNPVTKKYFPFKLNFITLTISSKQNVLNEFSYHNLLKPFLRTMRREGNFRYIWKAEFQKRGQLHYHLATNVFLTWQQIRSTWNKLQRKNKLLESYAKVHHHYDPNSTDIHAIGDKTKTAAYLSKYLCKDNAQGIKGKVWDCSKDISGARYSFTPTHAQEMYLCELQSNRQVEVVILDHCTIIKIKNPLHILTELQLCEFVKWQS